MAFQFSAKVKSTCAAGRLLLLTVMMPRQGKALPVRLAASHPRLPGKNRWLHAFLPADLMTWTGREMQSSQALARWVGQGTSHSEKKCAVIKSLVT